MTRLKAEAGHSGVKPENISVITPRFKFGWRRVGPGRNILEDVGHVPVIGPIVDATVTETLVDRTPLEVWRQKNDRTSVFDRKTDIPFGIKENRTLGLTTGIDTMFYLWDKHAWAEERRSMAEGIRSGVYDVNGDWSYDTWLRARSGLGPKVLSNLVQGALGPDHKPVPHFTEIMNLFEHSEDPHMRRREFWTDLAITLTAAVGPAAADFIMLKLAPATTETVNNPQVLATTAGGAAGGALGGIMIGLALDALPAKDLPKAAKVAIPLAAAILGAVGANFAVENWVIPGLDQKIEVTHVPLNDHGWTIPLVALGGAAIFGVPRFRKHTLIRDTVAEQLKEMGSWRDMFAMMASDVNYMSNVQAHWIANTPDPASAEAAVLNAKTTAVNRSVYTRYPALYNIAMKFAHRDPDHITEMRALAGHDLKTLAEQVLMVEMVSFNQGYANRSKGKPNPTIQGFLPDPGTYFAMLNKELLSTAAQNCDLVKTLVDKKDPVAALTLVSPTIAQIMITQSQEGNLGANDDTMHFGEAGMNTGTRGAFVHLVAETFNQLLTVPDSKRAELMNQLHKLGDQFTKAVPIGGLDRIYSAPAHMRLGALYGYALLRSREHSLNDPADASTEGDYGSKGLLSDVGKAALQSMQANPLLGYMFLADLSVAIENADALLPSVSPRDKRTIKNALVSLRRELASEIIRERFPKDKATAVQFFTDGDYAFNAYLALTMLEEVCGNDVVQPLLAGQAAVLSPLFAQDDLNPATNLVVMNERRAPSVVKFNGIVGDTPNLYTPQLIDFIWNAERHPGSKVHEQLVEFLNRGMLPLLVNEYIDRMKPGGRGEQFDEAQLANTVAFAGYALERAHCDDLMPLAKKLLEMLESHNRSVASSVAPLGSVIPPKANIENEAVNTYNRAIALIRVSERLLSSRAAELDVPLPRHGAARVTIATELARLVKNLNTEISTNIRATGYVPASPGARTP